ncbi:MAG: hypothetical protein R3332_08450 [Pseudohongiellaceae bacterium]|nr:hypothetical protein [Pseudohongiellaceae bacterium]
MRHYNFDDQFEGPVLSGRKRSTIRRRRKQLLAKGQQLSLHVRLRTAQSKRLLVTTVKSVEAFSINKDYVPFLSGTPLTLLETHKLAIDEGFNNAWEFVEYFAQKYGLPFSDAELIRW